MLHFMIILETKSFSLVIRISILPDGSLRIVNTQRTDSGLYMCRASNIHGNDQVEYNLRILGRDNYKHARYIHIILYIIKAIDYTSKCS